MTTPTAIRQEFSYFQLFRSLIRETKISFANPRFIHSISADRPGIEPSLLEGKAKFLLDFFKTGEAVSRHRAPLYDRSGFILGNYIWNHLNSFEPDAQNDMVQRVQLAAALFRPKDFKTLDEVTAFARKVKEDFVNQLCIQSHSVLCQELPGNLHEKLFDS